MSNDLIKREDAIRAIEELPNAYNGWSDAYDKAYIIGTLEEVPSADRPLKHLYAVEPNLILPERMERSEVYDVGETITVMNHEDYMDMMCKAMMWDEYGVEPKQGEWKPFDLTWGRSIWYCTACEESTEVPCDIWTHKPIYKYCPNCGAKMKGADDE